MIGVAFLVGLWVGIVIMFFLGLALLRSDGRHVVVDRWWLEERAS